MNIYFYRQFENYVLDRHQPNGSFQERDKNASMSTLFESHADIPFLLVSRKDSSSSRRQLSPDSHTETDMRESYNSNQVLLSNSPLSLKDVKNLFYPAVRQTIKTYLSNAKIILHRCINEDSGTFPFFESSSTKSCNSVWGRRVNGQEMYKGEFQKEISDSANHLRDIVLIVSIVLIVYNWTRF